jgi:dihydroorotase-like cyclic amidohydrolase
MAQTLIQGGQVVTPSGLLQVDILIKDGKIIDLIYPFHPTGPQI